MTPQEMVREFHETFGATIGTKAAIPSLEDEELRYRLIEEEAKEALDALEEQDLVGLAKELADVVYVAYGTAITYGIDLDAVVAEVHKSNLTKVNSDGTITRRPDGKILKPPTYQAPDVAAVLGVLF